MTWKHGAVVTITYGGKRVVGWVALASQNGRALFLNFDGMLDGIPGAMAVLQDHSGVYRSIISGEIATIEEGGLENDATT